MSEWHGSATLDTETWKHGDIDMRQSNTEKWRHGDMEKWNFNKYIKWKTEAQVIFLNLFTVCSSCKWKLDVCPLVDEETGRSYPFANGLNRLNGLAHLCISWTLTGRFRFRDLPYRHSQQSTVLFWLVRARTMFASCLEPRPLKHTHQAENFNSSKSRRMH